MAANSSVRRRDEGIAMVSSGLYPLWGIYFFFTNRAWWPLFGRKIPVLIIISTVILGFLFFWLYLPIAAFLLIFHGPTAWISAVFIVLGIGQVVVALLFEAFWVDEALVDVFDAILIKEDLTDLVSPFRFVDVDAPNAVKALGKPTASAVYSPFSFRQIIEFIFFLPLNLIPVVGSPMFLLVTGWRAGPLHHWRYFKLRGLNSRMRNAEIRERRWRYTLFGTVALALQLVPVLSMFFLLTTAAGSAIWAVRLERQRRAREVATPRLTATGLDGSADDGLEPYTDDP